MGCHRVGVPNISEPEYSFKILTPGGVCNNMLAATRGGDNHKMAAMGGGVCHRMVATGGMANHTMSRGELKENCDNRSSIFQAENLQTRCLLKLILFKNGVGMFTDIQNKYSY